MVTNAPTLDEFMHGVVKRNPGEEEFHQAVKEVAADVLPFVADKPKYKEWEIMRRIAEPDRAVMFRVTWMDDKAVEGSYDISAQKINSDGILLLDSNNSKLFKSSF